MKNAHVLTPAERCKKVAFSCHFRSVLALLLLFRLPEATATDVGGIIATDTTWTLSGSPYVLRSEVQVPYGATLTIQPGVLVIGAPTNRLTIFGTVSGIGTPSAPIWFANILLQSDQPTPGHQCLMDFHFCHFASSRIVLFNQSGRVNLEDSILQDYPAFQILAYPLGDCSIQRNIFYRCDGIVTLLDRAVTVLVKNNLFFQQPHGAVQNDALYNAGSTVVTGNSFLSTDRIALWLQVDASANIVATNNFWNTIDTNRIDSMIYDGLDSGNTPNRIAYRPFLSAPDPNTPSVPLPTISMQPKSASVIYGAPVTFVVQAQGFGDLAYQWQFNGTNLPGATNSTLVIDSAALYQAGDYSALVFNFVGASVRSDTATLSVAGDLPASIAGDSAGLFISSGIPPYPSYGYFLFIPATVGSSYSTIGIYNVRDSSGTYSYSLTGPGAAQLSLADAFAGQGTTYVAYNTPLSGTFYATANSAPGAYQTGEFESFQGETLNSMLSRTMLCTILDGLSPFASAGTFTFKSAASGNAYSVSGDGTHTANSSGTYAYSILNRSTGKLQITDTVVGTGTVYFAFGASTTGGFAIASPSTGGFQIGHFVLVDSNAPTAAITAPTNLQRWASSVFTVAGTATDDVQVASVSYQLNSAAWQSATGTTNWAALVSLSPGTNIIRAYATDTTGNKSATNSVSVDFVVTNLLGVRTFGLGTISPNYSNAWLEIGRNYSVTATPAAGFVFANWMVSTNWVGGAITNNATVQFVMQSNLTLQANFTDLTKPTLSIVAPISGQKMTNALAYLGGTASDNWSVAGVWVELNTGVWFPPTTTNNWKNWNTTLELLAGTNVVNAYAVDLAGNISATNKISLISSNTFKLQLILATPQPLKTNGFNLELQASVGLRGRVAVSTNLINWKTLTNFVGSNSTIKFIDPAGTNSGDRFYRATVP